MLESYAIKRDYLIDPSRAKMNILEVQKSSLESDETLFNPGWFAADEETFYSVE